MISLLDIQMTLNINSFGQNTQNDNSLTVP